MARAGWRGRISWPQRGVPGVVRCSFSEKASMLCKAAAMGDGDAYLAIAAAIEPKSAKALGRKVRGFRPELWERLV